MTTFAVREGDVNVSGAGQTARANGWRPGLQRTTWASAAACPLVLTPSFVSRLCT